MMIKLSQRFVCRTGSDRDLFTPHGEQFVKASPQKFSVTNVLQKAFVGLELGSNLLGSGLKGPHLYYQCGHIIHRSFIGEILQNSVHFRENISTKVSFIHTYQQNKRDAKTVVTPHL